MEVFRENKKIILVIFFIVSILVIFLVFFREESNGNKYKKFEKSEVEEFFAKEYFNKLQIALSINDKSFLTSKVNLEYLSYLDFNNSDFSKMLEEREFCTNNIQVLESRKTEYGANNIYMYDVLLNNTLNRINIIESYPEQWTYTLDTFIGFDSKAIVKEKNGYGVVINSIYQDINYIVFDCSLYVEENESNNINTALSDGIKLVMQDRSSLIMATNNYTSECSIINGRKYVNLKCIFNVPISSQYNINSIVFDSFYVHNDNKSVEVILAK